MKVNNYSVNASRHLDYTFGHKGVQGAWAPRIFFNSNSSVMVSDPISGVKEKELL